MTDEQIENAVLCCANDKCEQCPYMTNRNFEQYSCETFEANFKRYINRLKSEKQLAETKLKNLLSALYKLVDNKWEDYDLTKDDVIKLEKDYGIKEE